MKNNLLVHKHLIVRAEAMKPPMDEIKSCEWLSEFIKFIDMKPLVGPFAKYLDIPGNRGLTIAAIIETSHIVVHIWDEPVPALIQMDVYSCGEFDPIKVCDKIKEDFEITKIEYKFLNRETGLVDIK
jgi:S-adenosylmethionine/arginine decarboxylase-like enzyme